MTILNRQITIYIQNTLGDISRILPFFAG